MYVELYYIPSICQGYFLLNFQNEFTLILWDFPGSKALNENHQRQDRRNELDG